MVVTYPTGRTGVTWRYSTAPWSPESTLAWLSVRVGCPGQGHFPHTGQCSKALRHLPLKRVKLAQNILPTFYRLTPSSSGGWGLPFWVINGAAGLSDTQEAPCLPRTFLNSLQLDGQVKASRGSWCLAASGLQGCSIQSASSLYGPPPPPSRQENIW